jgi:hypothetical protein
MGNAILDAALRYAAMGLAVIPVEPETKAPYFKAWTEVATTDQSLIQKWWTQDARANVGIVTGKRSQAFVVDVDPRNGGEESIDTLFSKNGRFPDTWQDITGSGGRHYWFRYPAFPVGNKAGILPGIDIRGDGGQVVAPPSLNPTTGRRYIWDGLKEPWDDQQGLAEAPAWLLDLLHPHERTNTFVEIATRIPHGVQHQTLVSLAGAMRRMGLSPGEIFPTLQHVNLNRCEQPGPEVNIRKIAESMARYQPSDRSLYQEASKLWRLTRFAEERTKEADTADKGRRRPIDAYSLLTNEMEGVKAMIEGVLHNGVTLLAGPPKSGKSWVTLGMAIAVATGGKFLSKLGIKRPGRVAYFALEESENRTHNRLKMLVEGRPIALQNIEFSYGISSMDNGGMKELDTYLSLTLPNLVIIDTLMAFVTGNKSSRNDVFRQDYREIKALQELAVKHDTCILVVHHTNKVGGTGVTAVAGTHGVTAAADAVWTMKRQADRRAILDMTGREIEDQTLLIELELRQPIGWFIVEAGSGAKTSEERQEILELLTDEGALEPSRIATLLRRNAVTVRRLLMKLTAANLVVKDGKRYRIVNVESISRGYRDD